MSVKDVKEYYDQVCDQYHEMIETLHDFEEEAMKGLVEPERLEQIEQIIQPIKRNYETLSYIIFLLNKPVKKSKFKKYEKQNSKFINSLDKTCLKEGILTENNNVIKDLKDNIQEINN